MISNKKNVYSLYSSYDNIEDDDCKELNKWIINLDGYPEVSIKCRDDGFEIIFTEVGN